MTDKLSLRLDIDHRTKITTVTGYTYMETGEECCLDGLCLPVVGIAYTICR